MMFNLTQASFTLLPVIPVPMNPDGTPSIPSTLRQELSNSNPLSGLNSFNQVRQALEEAKSTGTETLRGLFDLKLDPELLAAISKIPDRPQELGGGDYEFGAIMPTSSQANMASRSKAVSPVPQHRGTSRASSGSSTPADIDTPERRTPQHQPEFSMQNAPYYGDPNTRANGWLFYEDMFPYYLAPFWINGVFVNPFSQVHTLADFDAVCKNQAKSFPQVGILSDLLYTCSPGSTFRLLHALRNMQNNQHVLEVCRSLDLMAPIIIAERAVVSQELKGKSEQMMRESLASLNKHMVNITETVQSFQESFAASRAELTETAQQLAGVTMRIQAMQSSGPSSYSAPPSTAKRIIIPFVPYPVFITEKATSQDGYAITADKVKEPHSADYKILLLTVRQSLKEVLSMVRTNGVESAHDTILYVLSGQVSSLFLKNNPFLLTAIPK
uniref:Uncharacterized protein n=1 Tax=Atrato Rhabdo-like virus 2 TaxID=2689334 RepID=A0A6B9KGZ7_9RHAB|nr:hypothetical protein [Atrato Rhabdo-like virus 2]